jgi:hypothetical protein
MAMLVGDGGDGGDGGDRGGGGGIKRSQLLSDTAPM